MVEKVQNIIVFLCLIASVCPGIQREFRMCLAVAFPLQSGCYGKPIILDKGRVCLVKCWSPFSIMWASNYFWMIGFVWYFITVSKRRWSQIRCSLSHFSSRYTWQSSSMAETSLPYKYPGFPREATWNLLLQNAVILFVCLSGNKLSLWSLTPM